MGFDDSCANGDSCTRSVGLAVRDGVASSTIAERYSNPDHGVAVYLPEPSAEVERLTAVQDLPSFLAGFLALLAATAISFAAASTVRRRRADLADPAGARDDRAPAPHHRHRARAGAHRTSAPRSGTVIGLVVGRLVWRAVTDSASLPYAPDVPFAIIVVVPLSALVLAQGSATLSRSVRRTDPCCRGAEDGMIPTDGAFL